MENFKNNECSPIARTALSLPLKSCAHLNLNIVDSENQQYETSENLELSCFAKSQIPMELRDIPIHLEDAIVNVKDNDSI
jgi:hypothetical protein